MKVSSIEEMRELDKLAIEKIGIPAEILMENAGNAAYFVILKELGVKGKKFTVICGTGNNGGDGFVTARKIHSSGGKVRVFILGDINKLKKNPRKNFEIISNMGIEIRSVKDINEIKRSIDESDAIVDAIFGIGLSREIRGIYRDVIDIINKSKKIIFSIDIPSGINGNNGKIMGIAVKANYTITFGLPKIGNLLYPGYEHCGKLYVSHISYPQSLYNTNKIKIETNDPIRIPPRKKDGHKGDFGDALFIAGALGYFGAPYFAAESFLKTGGGYSRLATPKSVVPFIATKGSEIVFIPMEETTSGTISLKNKEKILELVKKVDIVVIGPGLSRNEETQEFVREIVPIIDKPVIIDGDGITAVSKDIDIVRKRRYKTILTPHLGEMSRITGMNIKEIDYNKVEILRKTTKDLNSIIVLKGAHTLVGYSDGRIYVNMTGNSGMATAGSGDVLTGTIAAIYGLGLDIEDAVRVGVLIHSLSGDLAALKKGEDGMTAQDILDFLPLTMKYYREEFEKIKEKYSIKVI